MVQGLVEEWVRRESDEPVALGEEGDFLVVAEADGVGGAATGGAGVVDEE
jgi:hypothetical protein